MKGPFTIEFVNYFGIQESICVWAQTAEEAVELFEKNADYYLEIINVYFDWAKALSLKKSPY